MPDPVRVQISVGQNQNSQEWNLSLPLVLGRQENEDEPLWTLQPRGDHLRIAIVPFGQIDVSRRQLQFMRGPHGRVVIQNLSPANSVSIGELQLRETELSADGFVLPVSLEVANCRIGLEHGIRTLSQPTRFHTDIATSKGFRFASALAKLDRLETEEFVSFLNGIASVLQLSTNEQDLSERACEAVMQLIDVDGAAVFRTGSWERLGGDRRLRPHLGVLDRIQAERRVLWRETVSTPVSDTVPVLECYVAAPIVTTSSDCDEVYGALYAHRSRQKFSDRSPLTELHARLIELVACTLAAGIVRSQQEKQASRFEQFFTPTLAKQLVQGHQLLKAERRDVTVLFCDIRRFSAVCENLGPEETSKWVHDVLSLLSQCVHDHDGVLVDYVGDELMGMWGAPEDQPNHAELACQTALAMIDVLPTINAKWQQQIQHETCIGIGINSGPATVGNTGSRQKFKYGPLGDTVNRASRVQGLTKYLRVPILITENTRVRLNEAHPLRRIGNAKAVNMDTPIELFELIAKPQVGAPQTSVFEQAIVNLEAGRLHEAAGLLAPVLDFRHPDYPSILAFGEILDRLLHDKTGEKHQWDFGAK